MIDRGWSGADAVVPRGAHRSPRSTAPGWRLRGEGGRRPRSREVS